MHTFRCRFVIIGMAFFAILALGDIARAEKPPRIPAFHDGELVVFTTVNDNVVGIDQGSVLEQTTNPLYAFGPPGDQPQIDVLSVIPGEPGYNPHWEVFIVIPLDGRDVSSDPFTSELEILVAEAAGRVLVVDTNFVFLCQVLEM